ncbi:MAG: hypothetical protein QXQ81_10175, partial [Candidatus Thorarchaeota archaeon]
GHDLAFVVVRAVRVVEDLYTEITMGHKDLFDGDDYDHAIGIRPDSDPESIVRILHCRPCVQEGDRVDVGDCLGTTLRSRFFSFWTSPHYHVEAMHQSDYRRSSRSYPLNVPPHRLTVIRSSARTNDEMLLEVVSSGQDYVLAASDDFVVSAGPFVGHPAVDSTGRLVGIIDAGLPHYPVCGAYGLQESVSIAMRFCGTFPLGRLVCCRAGLSSFSTEPCEFRLDNIRIHGVSTYIYPNSLIRQNRVPLKLIPPISGVLADAFSEGDVVTLSWTAHE